MLEVVCCSPDDCAAAEEAGASRIELCSALEVAGLTPTRGLMLACRQSTSLPIMVMIRPRSGEFRYSAGELEAMERDTEDARESGMAGIVFGIIDGDRRIDRSACERILRRADGLSTTFHRVFDVIDEPLQALIDLGFTNLLTSGHAPTAAQGLADLSRLHSEARGRIQILVAGGVRSSNLPELIAGQPSRQFHMGPVEVRHGIPGVNSAEVKLAVSAIAQNSRA